MSLVADVNMATHPIFATLSMFWDVIWLDYISEAFVPNRYRLYFKMLDEFQNSKLDLFEIRFCNLCQNR